MAEYIEREAAIAAAFCACAIGNSAYRDVYDTVSRIRFIPAADVRPVVKAKWELDSDKLPICPNSGEIALQRVFVKVPNLIQDVRMVMSNFCPNCGADMRGEHDE